MPHLHLHLAHCRVFCRCSVNVYWLQRGRAQRRKEGKDVVKKERQDKKGERNEEKKGRKRGRRKEQKYFPYDKLIKSLSAVCIK